MKAGPVAIIGTGPAALMAATHFVESGVEVHLFEKRKAPGRKLLIAGSSGLNVSWQASGASEKEQQAEFLSYYKQHQNFISPALHFYSPQKWLRFIENLGHKPFVGTSKRIFVEDFKGAGLLKSWISLLTARGAHFHYEMELHKMVYQKTNAEWEVHFKNENENKKTFKFPFLILALGGASWEESLPLWPSILTELGIEVEPFSSSNCGFEVRWSEKAKKMLTQMRVPVKNCVLSNASGSFSGELLFTEYGVEGTPVYHQGCIGVNQIDFLPQYDSSQILDRFKNQKENYAPFRALQKSGLLDPVLQDMLFYEKKELIHSKEDLVRHMKKFEINFERKRPLSEAISSQGGVSKSEIDCKTMQSTRYPTLFFIGEMIDWDAPTGGFLIQACVSQGALAAHSIFSM